MSLQEQLCEWDNLELAWRNASRGKRGRSATAAFESLLADHLLELQEELASRTYRPAGYTSFHIHEPKKRLISAAPFRDRVVHHAKDALAMAAVTASGAASATKQSPGDEGIASE